ncbi:MAG: hypothetical protein IJ828_08080 [Treponema sp.]|nr:hypothetical protein [Treponema sp.]
MVESTLPASALRYISISSLNNVPLFNVQNIDDFKLIISEHSLSMVYRTSTQFIAIADGTYFAFSTNGYSTIEDFEEGIQLGFKIATDFNAAKNLGINEADFYYWYKNNSFSSVEDAHDAYKNGFYSSPAASWNGSISSQNYYKAKELGYATYSSYKEYLDYTALGYKTKGEWESAQKAGFKRADEYRTAQNAGFATFTEYGEAKKLGISKKDSYDSYKAMTDSIDKVVEKNKLTRAEGFVLVLLQDFPKGDLSTSVLSSRLRDMLSRQSDITTALSAYVFGTTTNDYNRRNGYGGSTGQSLNITSEIKTRKHQAACLVM